MEDRSYQMQKVNKDFSCEIDGETILQTSNFLEESRLSSYNEHDEARHGKAFKGLLERYFK